jgi:hypothetical protein
MDWQYAQELVKIYDSRALEKLLKTYTQ